MIVNLWEPKFATKTDANESDIWKRGNFDFRMILKSFWASVINCVTDQQPITEHDNSMSKICPKIQVLSFQFYQIDALLNEHQVRNVKREIFAV